MHNMSDKVTNVDLAKFQGKLSWWFLGSSHIINQCTSVHWKALAYDQQYMSTDAVVEECSLHEWTFKGIQHQVLHLWIQTRATWMLTVCFVIFAVARVSLALRACTHTRTQCSPIYSHSCRLVRLSTNYVIDKLSTPWRHSGHKMSVVLSMIKSSCSPYPDKRDISTTIRSGHWLNSLSALPRQETYVNMTTMINTPKYCQMLNILIAIVIDTLSMAFPVLWCISNVCTAIASIRTYTQINSESVRTARASWSHPVTLAQNFANLTSRSDMCPLNCLVSYHVFVRNNW